ncbi:hypothetical protein [Oryza sativa Japonica Group]|uniref:Uncharacterized protein n=1 Tax=Oryza sativa subsp. japonica TaxID=39947 RepID=Q5Z8D4_ORYSJ|nr:hypothetical protein [Oryza sativa Japonica Group]BAD53950.1 hypothetical protein [Oryza sativa Japonica Group]
MTFLAELVVVGGERELVRFSPPVVGLLLPPPGLLRSRARTRSDATTFSRVVVAAAPAAAAASPAADASSPSACQPAQSREKADRERERERGGKERKRVAGLLTWHTDTWGPRGSHADSAAMSNKTRVKTAEGPNLHWFCKLGDTLYSVLRLGDDFVTRCQVEGTSVYFFLCIYVFRALVNILGLFIWTLCNKMGHCVDLLTVKKKKAPV